MSPLLFTSLAQLLEFLNAVKGHFTDEEFADILFDAKGYWQYKDTNVDIAQTFWNALMLEMDKLTLSVIHEAMKKIGIK